VLSAIVYNNKDVGLSKPAARKRRPGGGRKPSPTAAGAPLSVRIEAETRAALEAEAAKSGKKLSRVVARLLREGIEDRGYQPSGPLRALGILIESIEHGSRLYAGDGKVREWNSDPTAFEVFRLAIGKLIEKLRPPGDIDTSIDGPLIGRSPEEQAEAIFRRVWSDMLTAPPPVATKDLIDYYDHYGPASREVNAMYGEVSRRSHRIERVRKDLNIKGKESEK
jgi:hypothetical protein